MKEKTDKKPEKVVPDAAELAAKIHLPEEDAELGCAVNRFVLYYANVKKGYRENGECIRTT